MKFVPCLWWILFYHLNIRSSIIIIWSLITWVFFPISYHLSICCATSLTRDLKNNIVCRRSIIPACWSNTKFVDYEIFVVDKTCFDPFICFKFICCCTSTKRVWFLPLITRKPRRSFQFVIWASWIFVVKNVRRLIFARTRLYTEIILNLSLCRTIARFYSINWRSSKCIISTPCISSSGDVRGIILWCVKRSITSL
jgi:hypothetical protein